ncbi:sigma-70 family RNA polymerase sigma factor [Rhodoplanes sp. Z2-YC6860]|uniref:sigma-70 family RNA polymerase sigma factor n=1 Tax=Rhodoplanes sp. Z2-YC6860 TaxID=674703 RepID=UPI00078DE2F1|nr:sigma-70 family RNA polymerase sigma factor [Rhodoplanes sp. Z2-YC6860]AMN40022.1 sigma-70 family RNA polymerase sigma factor [Rhodoplanes sp. Z2-YC6860]
MTEEKLLAERFEANRAHLRGVAYRMLGSRSEADDAIQEAWLRLSRSDSQKDSQQIDNLGGWLTTVVARICLDMLRSRKSRHEEPLGPHVPEPATGTEATEQEAMLADSVGLALLVVLQTLTPAERIAFVLHDMFDVPFDDVASIVGRTPAAARQLASRARRRVQGADKTPDADIAGQKQVVDAFLAASRGGDFEGLLKLLDPDVVFRADLTATRMGGVAELHGAQAVAKSFNGRAQAARTALIDGAVGAMVAPNGQLLLVVRIVIAGGKIAGIEAVADREQLGALKLDVLES